MFTVSVFAVALLHLAGYYWLWRRLKKSESSYLAKKGKTGSETWAARWKRRLKSATFRAHACLLLAAILEVSIISVMHEFPIEHEIQAVKKQK